MLISKNIQHKIFKGLIFLAFTYFFVLMLRITLFYVPLDSTANFLAIKQTEVEERPEYLTIFHIHVYTSIFVLVAGFIALFFNKSLKKIHRWSGRVYVILTLVFSSISGIYMAFFANGGIPAKISFVILGLLWFYSTYRAYQEVRNRNIMNHRHWMWRSYTLCFSAVTLRLWKVILVYLFHPNPMDVYQVIAWLGWIPNILFVEYLILKNKK